jgi:hypothetical protein
LRPDAQRHQPVSGAGPSGFDSRRLHQPSLTFRLATFLGELRLGKPFFMAKAGAAPELAEEGVQPDAKRRRAIPALSLFPSSPQSLPRILVFRVDPYCSGGHQNGPALAAPDGNRLGYTLVILT